MNKVFLIGNLSTDVDKKETSNGTPYCRFSIAVNRRFAKSNEETDFFNIICWRALAENCANNLSKGKKVSIVGSIQINKYQAQDGTNRQTIDIQADEVEFLSPRDGSKAAAEQGDSEPEAIVEDTTVAAGELPF